jgi:hypothetical protein
MYGWDSFLVQNLSSLKLTIKARSHGRMAFRKTNLGVTVIYKLIPLHFQKSTNEKIYSDFYSSCFSTNVEIDVGYCSSINNWEKPFKLTCVQANNKNSHRWVGFIPNSEFKFIKIDHKGKITRENGLSKNQPRCNCDLQAHPITFPK